MNDVVHLQMVRKFLNCYSLSGKGSGRWPIGSSPWNSSTPRWSKKIFRYRYFLKFIIFLLLQTQVIRILYGENMHLTVAVGYKLLTPIRFYQRAKKRPSNLTLICRKQLIQNREKIGLANFLRWTSSWLYNVGVVQSICWRGGDPGDLAGHSRLVPRT